MALVEFETHNYSYQLLCKTKGFEFHKTFKSLEHLEKNLEKRVASLISKGFVVKTVKFKTPLDWIKIDPDFKVKVDFLNCRIDRNHVNDAYAPSWLKKETSLVLSKSELSEKLFELFLSYNKSTFSVYFKENYKDLVVVIY